MRWRRDGREIFYVTMEGELMAAEVAARNGTLEVGKFADLVVLSRDILADAERDHISEAKVDLTVVGGKVVYERKK